MTTTIDSIIARQYEKCGMKQPARSRTVTAIPGSAGVRRNGKRGTGNLAQTKIKRLENLPRVLALLNVSVLPDDIIVKATPGTTNGYESDALGQMRLNNAYAAVEFEPISLRLAKGSVYTPDIVCRDVDGVIWCYEVKGNLWREAARVRIKVAARLFPHFRFVVVRKVDGVWGREEIREKQP